MSPHDLPGGVPARATGDALEDLGSSLRQMVAALQAERQALATLDTDALFDAAQAKEGLCDLLARFDAEALDPNTRELALIARDLNEANRRVRNLLAAHVSSRLEALGGPSHAYSSPEGARPGRSR